MDLLSLKAFFGQLDTSKELRRVVAKFKKGDLIRLVVKETHFLGEPWPGFDKFDLMTYREIYKNTEDTLCDVYEHLAGDLFRVISADKTIPSLQLLSVRTNIWYDVTDQVSKDFIKVPSNCGKVWRSLK